MNIMKADFYKYIPLWMKDQLKMLYSQYYHREWFTKAFEEYRKVILDDIKNKRTIHMPGYSFNKYLKQEFEINRKLKKKPLSLGNGFFKCLNCENTFLAKNAIEKNNCCPNCGIEFLSIPGFVAEVKK